MVAHGKGIDLLLWIVLPALKRRQQVTLRADLSESWFPVRGRFSREGRRLEMAVRETCRGSRRWRIL